MSAPVDTSAIVNTTAIDDTTPVDHAQRAAALDPTRSFCVTAPAGSGKTELLSQRVLALLAHVQQPEEVLAITFTRKAAAEMRERILHALHAAQLPEPGEAHKRKTWQLAHAALLHADSLGWNLLQNPARLRVQTIDGLCSSLTAQMPVLSQFGGQPRIVERAEPLYRAAIDALLLQLETDGSNHHIGAGDDLAALLLHLDNRVERLHELLAGLLSCRDQWLPHIGRGFHDQRGAIKNRQAVNEAVRAHLEKTLRQVRCDALAKLCENMQLYHGDIVPLLDFAAARLRESHPDHALCAFAGCVDLPEAQSEAVAQWQHIANWLLTQKGAWRSRITVKEGFPPGVGDNKLPYKQRKETMELLLETFSRDDALRELLDEVRFLPAARYADTQWQILVHLTQVLVQAVAQLDVVFQTRGEVDFTEISLAALRALGNALNPSELMLRLDQRIGHLLIDEFQDTSSTQFRLLERLIEGWREHNESGAAPRTLFIVGDGMQSIYGFREAKVGLFLEAKEQGVNQLELIEAPLSVNFRSTPTIVNWNNRVFAEAFPHVEHIARGAVPYESSTAFKQGSAESDVKIFGLRNDPERSAEARQVVELVQQALRRDSDGTIAILVRSRPHLAAIVPALQRANIAFRATDIDPLAQRAHVRDLLVLLKALLNPADRIAWLALLRSPLIGLDNKDLHALVAVGDNALRTPIVSRLRTADAHSIGAAQRARLDRVMTIIDSARRQRARKSLRVWLEGIWIALGGDLLAASPAAQADIQAVFELIEALDAEFTVQELERRLQNLYARPAAALDTRVVLMTIHKSKGLEFDTVIIPALDAGARSDEKPLLRWSEYLGDDGSLGITLAPKAAVGGDDDTIYRWLEYEHKQQKLLEDTRLLYVAATRAVKHLYLLFRCKSDEEFKNPPSHSLLNRIWPAVQDEVIWIDVDAQPVVDENSDDMLQRVPPHWHAQPQTDVVIGIADNPPQLLAHSLETQIGSALHRVLEMLARFNIDWPAYTAVQRGMLVVQVLRQIGVPDENLDAASAQILQSIEAMLADERGRWLLANDHAEAVTEWELMADGKRFVIDRSFVVHENGDEGERWIIDYKNSAPLAHESIEQFARRESETYKTQLQSYRDLVSVFDKRPIRAALYFPRIAHWLEVIMDSK